MAGVPTVVGTLWRADDEYSKLFGRLFYKHLNDSTIFLFFSNHNLMS